MIEFKDDDIFKTYDNEFREKLRSVMPSGPNGTLYLNHLDCSIGIIVECDPIMTQIYWIDGKWEWMHTHDLNSAVNVEIL